MTPTWAELWQRFRWLAYSHYRAWRKARQRRRIAKLQAKRYARPGAIIAKVGRELSAPPTVAKLSAIYKAMRRFEPHYDYPLGTTMVTTMRDGYPPPTIKGTDWDRTFDGIWEDSEGSAA